MPASNTSSPVKRPGLGRRAISSHAVVTRSSSTLADQEDDDPLFNVSQKPPQPHHRHHRTHVVGGGHRHHTRNPSFGKNLTKLQRHHSSTHFGPETSTGRHHQRKKSAPATPAAGTPATSPRGQHHVRWDGAVDDKDHHTPAPIKKNNSSPALRRNSSGALAKKAALVSDRPHTSSGKKKTVGFELGDSDNEDGEWEDTTQSPESTRRSSVAQSKDSVENQPVLVDPLTFVKRSWPQFPRATSLPEPSSKGFDKHLPNDDDEEDEEEDNDGNDDQKQQPSDAEQREALEHSQDHGDIATRLLSPSHSAKAPPAMSSISATAKPALVDAMSRNTSLTNLASSHDNLRRPQSSSNATLGSTAQATSSSIEGGVSRFIVNNKGGAQASSRTDSDPNTPSSFLPHYHPQTPPSPNRATGSKKPKSPPSRPPGTEPPSRTQQKLWLQRTATLNNSPPDSHGGSATASPSAIDPTFLAAGHGRSGAGAYDAGRGLVNGASRVNGVVHDSEAKHIRKAYEKSSLELTVVRRFQSPTGDSFRRLESILRGVQGAIHERGSSLGKPIKSAPVLTNMHDAKQQRNSIQSPTSPEPRQLISRRGDASASHTYIPDPEDLATDSDGVHRRSQHPSHRMLSTSVDEAAHPNPTADEDADDASTLVPNESEMMIRRMWESREVATSG